MNDPNDPRELADEIAAYVARTDWVTCGEIINRFGDDLRGSYAIEIMPHLITWCGIAPLLLETMQLFSAERPRRVVLWPIHPLADLCDASPMVNLPRAKRIPRDGYKKDHYIHLGLRPVARLREDERRKAGIDR